MLTIDRLAKLDDLATRAFTAVRKGVDWLGDQYETCLVNATYRVVEAKAAAIDKTSDKIFDLEDAYIGAGATYIEAKAKLRADFERLVESLDKARATAEADIHAKLADVALAHIAAGKDYDATVKAASDKLGVEIKS